MEIDPTTAFGCNYRLLFFGREIEAMADVACEVVHNQVHGEFAPDDLTAGVDDVVLEVGHWEHDTDNPRPARLYVKDLDQTIHRMREYVNRTDETLLRLESRYGITHRMLLARTLGPLITKLETRKISDDSKLMFLSLDNLLTEHGTQPLQ